MDTNPAAGTDSGLPLQMEHADNLQYMSGFPDESIKLIVTSPPYNIGKPYENQTGLDVWQSSQEEVIAECVRLCHPEGSICWQVGNHVNKGEIVPLDIILYPVFASHGLQLRNRIIWTFGHGLHCRRRLSGRYETILWWTKNDNYTWHLDPIRVPSKYPNKRHYKGPRKGQLSGNPLGKNPSDVWDITNVKYNHPEKTEHPCQFPVALVDRLVASLTDPGDAVLDPYAGSGSTLAAARQRGRAAYGCDINADYVNIARRRLGLLG